MKKAEATAAGGSETVKVGNVSVEIDSSTTRGRPLYTIVYRDTNNVRVRKSLANLAAARTEAHAVAAIIEAGRTPPRRFHRPVGLLR